MHDAAPAEVLDRFIRGLQASIRAQVLVADPQTFERAALLAERVAGAHREAAHIGPHPWTLERYMAMQMATLAQVAAWPTTMDALKAPKAIVNKAQVGKGCAITANNLAISCCHVESWNMTCRHEDRDTRGAVTRGHVPTRFRVYQLKSPCCNQPERSRETRTGSDQCCRSLPTAH